MSWKSLLSVGLLCAIASPAFAQPALNVNISGTSSVALNAQGDWVWRIGIDPVTLVDTDGGGPAVPSTPMAAELGFRETGVRNIVGATKNATNWDRNNPGGSNAAQLLIFGWENTTDVDPGAGVNNRPVGLQARCSGCAPGAAFSNATNVENGTDDEVAAFLGSIDFTSTGVKQFIEIVVDGPIALTPTGSDPALRTTSLQWLGTYGGGNNMGRIAALNPAADFTQDSGPGNFHAINHNIYAGTLSRTALPGDANLDNSVGGGDFAIWFGNVGRAGTPESPNHWGWADFNGDGSVGGGDFAIWFANVGAGGGGSDGGASGSPVPEPATVSLFALGFLGFWGLVSRRRK